MALRYRPLGEVASRFPVEESPAIIKVPVITEEKREVKEESISFYRSFRYHADVSFWHHSQHLVEEFKKLGIPIYEYDVYDPRVYGEEQKDNYCLLLPFFAIPQYELVRFSKAHARIAMCEVADTTRISINDARRLNDPRIDCIFLPSSFAKNAYITSGVRNRVEVVPHGVCDLYKREPSEIKTKLERLKKLRKKYEGMIKFLYFCLHSQYRKGAEYVKSALTRLKHDFDFVLLLKSRGNPLGNVPFRMEIIDEFLDEEDLIYLYDTCDILLSPHRGGSFELNPLEAMARGLITIITGWELQWNMLICIILCW